MNFDKWLRNLTEELQDKIEPEDVSKPGDTSDIGQTSPKNYDPNKVKVSWGRITIDGFSEGDTITIDDLYSHKDFARNNDNIVVSGEIGPDAQYKGMDPPFGFNVGDNWFRDQEAYEEFLELEKKVNVKPLSRAYDAWVKTGIPEDELSQAMSAIFPIGYIHATTLEYVGDTIINFFRNGQIWQATHIQGETVYLRRVE